MRKTLVALALVLLAGLTLSACSDNGDSENASSQASSEFNDADVSFAQQMIPHHQQAIEMSQLVDGRSNGAEVTDLAAKIEAAQGPEIETLTGWLEDWDQDVPSGEMDHGDMGDGSGDDAMSGMMTEDQMVELENSTGPKFDRLFLELMIQHHEGAVEMAQTEIDNGKNEDAVAMAKKIVSDQEAEIAQMQKILDS